MITPVHKCIFACQSGLVNNGLYMLATVEMKLNGGRNRATKPALIQENSKNRKN
jgi:hypothetical protein